MKIKITGERECCDSREDFKAYKGAPLSNDLEGRFTTVFCIHCGQVWVQSYHMDAAAGHHWQFKKARMHRP